MMKNIIVKIIICQTRSMLYIDVVWLPQTQMSTKDQNDTWINNYRSAYSIFQLTKPLSHAKLCEHQIWQTFITQGLWILA